MKTKRIGAALIAVALVAMLLLTACGGGGSSTSLSGTFSDDLGEISVTFSGQNNIEITEYGFTVSGTYRLNDGVITVSVSRSAVRAAMEAQMEEMELSLEEFADEIEEELDLIMEEFAEMELIWDEDADTIDFEGFVTLTRD
ncbi:MAG: hypothetical protein FWE06_03870 [Oscillospiraceae bacterium]|nr:hypothetical protein [Oscillospiraceae bacterium]